MKDEEKTKKQLILELKELRSTLQFKNSSLKNMEHHQIKAKNIVDGSPVPQFVIDKNHKIIYWNWALEEYSGIKESEVIGTNQHWRAFYAEERPCLADILIEGVTNKINKWYHGKYSPSKLIEGAYEATDFFPDMMGGVWLYFTASTIFDDDGNIIGAVETLSDVTERKNAEAALINSEKKYRSVIENIQDVFYRTDKEGNLIMLSPSVKQLLGYSVDEALSNPASQNYYFNPTDRFDFLKELEENGTIKNYEAVLRRKDSTLVTVETNSHYYYGEDGQILGIEGIFRDISERKKAENQLKNSLREKEILLKEIHHRVKNNMQIVYSLLSLQSECITNEKYKNIFIENQNRVKSMAVVHEKLYLSSDFSKIDFNEYLNSLIIEIFISYDINPEKIKVNLKDHSILMGIDTAIPCGLIITELITNSIKHAFPEGNGDIIIDLYFKEGTYFLMFSDDGVGIPSDIDFDKNKTLGIQLIKTLVKQLDGNIELDLTDGTKYIITFKELKYKDRLFEA